MLKEFKYDGEVYFKDMDNLLYTNDRQLVAKINLNNDVIFFNDMLHSDEDEFFEKHVEEMAETRTKKELKKKEKRKKVIQTQKVEGNL